MKQTDANITAVIAARSMAETVAGGATAPTSVCIADLIRTGRA